MSRMHPLLLPKLLQAVGIAALGVGLIQGIYAGDMWGELYFLIGGIVFFYAGRWIEKRKQ